MISLDLPSLSLVALLTSLLLPLVLFAAGSVTQADAASRTWTRGAALYSLGFIGLALRGFTPDFLSIVLSNTILVAGYMELLAGVCLFFGREVRRSWWRPALAAYLAIQITLTYIVPSLPGRTVLASVYLLTLSLLIARELLAAARLRRHRPGDASERRLLHALAGVFVLTGLSFGGRILAIPLASGAADLQASTQTFAALSFLIGILLNFIMVSALPLLVALRGQGELRHSAWSLHRAQHLAGLGSVEINRNTGAMRTNDVLASVLGIAPGRTHTVAEWLALIHPEDRPRMAQRYQDVFTGEARAAVIEYRIVRPSDGALRWISSMSEASRDPVDDAPLLRITLRDVTEVKQAALATEEAARAKAEFFASMSHELRTPLNGVIGMAQLLTRAELDEEHREWAQVILDSGQDLLSIINDILDLSKIEAGHLTLAPHPFSPEELMNALRAAFTAQAQAAHTTLTIQVAPDLPAIVMGDALRVRQILGNLLSNALKFARGGTVSVQAENAEVTMGEGGKATLRVVVSDNGIGMTQETLAALFTPYFQADGSITRRFGGTGLGLSICKRLVDLMGGSIRVESTLGQGSRFTVELPLALEKSDAQPSSHAAAAGAGG